MGPADEWQGATSDNVQSLGEEASREAGLQVLSSERDPAPQRHWPGNRQLLITASGNMAPPGLPRPRVRLALKLRYASLWRTGEKWYEIRLLTDLGVGTKAGDVIELEHLGLCVVSCTQCCLARCAPARRVCGALRVGPPVGVFFFPGCRNTVLTRQKKKDHEYRAVPR